MSTTVNLPHPTPTELGMLVGIPTGNMTPHGQMMHPPHLALINPPPPPTILTSNVSTSQKTPISTLQEICTKRGISPKYELQGIQGPVHDPSFIYMVTVGELSANGQGSSKKKAKHRAAQNALDKIEGLPETFPITRPTPPQELPKSAKQSDHIPGNPIGALQEFAMVHHWPPPLYTIADEKGQPHEREYVFTVQVCGYTETGEGKSKRLAKRNAAFRVLQKLVNLKENTDGGAALKEWGDKMRALDIKPSESPLHRTETTMPSPVRSHQVFLLSKLAHLRNTSTTGGGKPSSSSDEEGKMMGGSKLSKLSEQPLNGSINYQDLLEETMKECDVDIQYYDLPEKTVNGYCQSLVAIGLHPSLSVCYGIGEKSEDSRKYAAFTALHMLKMLLRDLPD